METGTWLGTVLDVELPDGAREVELRYTAPGLVPGIGLGVLAVPGLVLASTKSYIRRQKYRKRRG